jgi:hypothetical protein
MFKQYDLISVNQTESSLKDHFFCSVCGFILKTEDDLQKHSEYLCCNECYLNFAESRIEEWKLGWRPKKRDIKKYINDRKRLIINITKNQELM